MARYQIGPDDVPFAREFLADPFGYRSPGLQRVLNVMTVSEEEAKQAMRALAFPKGGEKPIVAGESGAAGLAGLLAIARDQVASAALKLHKDSRVLVINTETATDPASYEAIVGLSPTTVMQKG